MKWFSIPLIHMLDATPETRGSERRKRERVRVRRLHASFRVGHRAVTAITKNNMQHSQRKEKKKERKQPPLITLQVQREDDSGF